MKKRQLLDKQTKALIQTGYIGWSDLLFLITSFLYALVLTCWAVFGQFDPLIAALAISGLLLLVLVWVLMTLFRCMYFVIQLMADIKMLPADAAKLALKFSVSQVDDQTPHE